MKELKKNKLKYNLFLNCLLEVPNKIIPAYKLMNIDDKRAISFIKISSLRSTYKIKVDFDKNK